MKRSWKIGVFIAYGLLMLWLLFGQRVGQAGEGLLQLQPLKTLRHFLWVISESKSHGLRLHAAVNLVGNVVMFVPLGFLIPWIWQRWQCVWRHALLMVAVIVVVELSQYLFGLGTCDVDDLLLNLVGTGTGYGLLMLWLRLAKKTEI